MVTSSTKERFDHIKSQLFKFGCKIMYDWSFSLASLISYYLLISILPMILSLFAMMSLIFGNDTEFLDKIRQQISETFPNQGFAEVIDALVKSLSKQAGLVFAITFIAAIFTSSRLLIGVDDILTLIYRLRERPVLKQNYHAIKLMLVFIIIAPIILIISVIPMVLGYNKTVMQLIVTLIRVIFSFILSTVLYYFVPPRQMSFRNM